MVIRPKTGEILAMVSLPDFDPGELSSASKNSLGNRAITDPFEPGSIFKPIVASLAIDTGIITTNEKIYCEKGNYHGRFGFYYCASKRRRSLQLPDTAVGFNNCLYNMRSYKFSAVCENTVASCNLNCGHTDLMAVRNPRYAIAIPLFQIANNAGIFASQVYTSL